MKNIALLASYGGLILLIIIFDLSNPLTIYSKEQIEKLQPNQKIELTGQITDQKIYQSQIVFTINNISVYCNCKEIPIIIGKNITVLGLIDDYLANKIRVLELNIRG